MSDLPFDVSLPINAPRGRTIKFTPERMDQIRNLVERGVSREEIAETIGCTVGSLQVTCSKAGISLRKPKRESNGVALRPKLNGHSADVVALPPRKEPPPPPPPRKTTTTLILRLESPVRAREFSVPFPTDKIAELSLLAEVRGMSMGDLIAEALAECVQRLAEQE